VFTAIVLWPISGTCQLPDSNAPSAVTLLCYLNGDNDLALEVLHTLDIMETIGSSPAVNVVVLVDGHPAWLGPYGEAWSGTRLLYLQADAHIGNITSPVIAEWGEADLGSSDTLEAFVREALRRFPAQRYLFYAFAHGQGVIDTHKLDIRAPGKTMSISRDTTNHSKMALDQFQQAMTNALGGRSFDLMVLFSCLSSMVEVGFSLSDITHYLVASEDEIRLLNQPQGAFQVRGLKVEQMIAALHRNPHIESRTLGHLLVNSHVENYRSDVLLWADQASSDTVRLAASMALVDCRELPRLAGHLDVLATHLIAHIDDADVLQSVDRALRLSQPFASFLNLEYYDLADFIRHLCTTIESPEIVSAGEQVLAQLQRRVIVYERHTRDRRAHGLSIYLSNPLIPQNIFESHQRMYRTSRFSSDTQWDEWIAHFRKAWKTFASPQEPFKGRAADSHGRSLGPRFRP
jgi:hypothetical protein